jgi:hypothetical protein
LFGPDGTAIEPALADVATQPEEHVGDGLVFDAFGHGGEHKAIAEANDSGGDLSALSRMRHGADEAGIDLEFVEGKELQVTKTGVARSEVVERQPGALLLQLGGDASGVFGVADESAFSDFEDEPVERELCVFGGEADVPGETEVG